MEEIGSELEKFAAWLHRLQSADLYYAAPGIYQRDERLFGVYSVGADIDSILPFKPHVFMNQIEGVEDWYAMIAEGKTIRYEKLVDAVMGKARYYDHEHMIVTLHEDEVAELLELYYEAP